MCLEEMFSAVIPEGAIFYGETRRREAVEITNDLKNRVRDMFQEMHQYYERRYTPKVKWSKRCNGCSLKDICLPKLGNTVSAKEYVKRALEEAEMKKLLNTLYVTSEDSYLALDGENIVVLDKERKWEGFRFIIWKALFHLATVEQVRL